MTTDGRNSTYRLFGLDICSEVDLKPFSYPHPQTTEPGLTVRWGRKRDIPCRPPDGELFQEYTFGNRGYVSSRTASGFTIRFFGLCDFHVDQSLTGISVDVNSHTDPRWAALLLTGTVLSILLQLRGSHVLHASAVARDKGILAFLGASGMGKSTIATLFALRGSDLATDDVLRVDIDDGITCHRGTVSTRIRSGSSGILEYTNIPGIESVDERTFVPLCSSFDGRARLERILIPYISKASDSVNATRLSTAQALVALSSYPRVPGVQDKTLNRTQFENSSRIAANIPIYEIDIPSRHRMDRHLPDQIVAALEKTSEADCSVAQL